MKYYTTWQEAFQVFIKKFGHNYQDSYNLAAEFEQQLRQNRRGAYYLIDTEYRDGEYYVV